MTSAGNFSERDREIDRQFRSMDRRIQRLENTQMTPQELNGYFERVYDEIDGLEDEMNKRFEQVNRRFDAADRRFDEINGKLNTIMQHLTGTN